MIHSSDSFIDTQIAIVDAYCASERMPEDFQSAMGKLIRMGFDHQESSDLLREACL